MVRGKLHRQQAAVQPLDDHARDVAAAVGAVVDQQRFFAKLRIIPLDELANAVLAHVRQVHIADAAVRQLVHAAAVLLHPVEIQQVGFARQRLDK